MFCSHCGKEVDDSFSFCPGCGSRIEPIGGTASAVPPAVDSPKPRSGAGNTVIAVVILIAALIAAYAFIAPDLSEEWDTWDDSEYTVTIVNGEHIISSSGAGIYGNEKVTVKAVVENGYAFDGWYDENGKRLSSDITYRFDAKDITLYPKGGIGVSVTLEMGLGVETVTGDGMYAPGSSQYFDVSLLTGYNFKGWYSVYEGKIVSTKASGPVPIGNGGTIVALSDKDRYEGDETLYISPKNAYSQCTWIVTDYYTGNFVASVNDVSDLYMSIAPGKYSVTVSGYVGTASKSESFTELVDGEIKNEYSWKFKGKTYGAVWTVTYSMIDSIYSKTSNRHPATKYITNYVQYQTSTMEKLADYLAKQSSGMSEVDRADFVLAFVQQVTAYELDERYNGKTEYWKYPQETLFDRRGDCEDTSILYCAIMKAMGYDVAMILFTGEQYVNNGHAGAGVALSYVADGRYYEVKGKKYYFCETTSDTMRVGDLPEDYNKGKVYVIS